jgi:hypothetical protein
MYIEQLCETPNHKVGDKYDERPESARMLISQGYAREIPRGPREMAAIATSVGSTVVDPVPLTWSVVKHAVNGEILVQRKCGFETTLWDKPPKECPADVAAEWRALTGQKSLRDRANDAVRAVVDRGRP